MRPLYRSARLRQRNACRIVAMTVIYLALNAILYVVLAAWCTLLPGRTSEAIGFAFTKAAARSEYITVYGGLELGMGIFFALAVFVPGLRPGAIVFALAAYGCLAVFRVATLLAIEGVGRFPFFMLAIELPMALVAAWLTFRAGGAAAALR